MHDYIIVGSGSAGSVLANRLSTNGRHRVLVLEAGGSDLHPWVQIPIGYGKAYYDARINWKFTSEPVPGLGGKTSYWPRGKVMGGSSSINAMVYVRGHPSDFDDWQVAGAKGWGWSDVESYFRKLEDWRGPPSQARGTSGPLTVIDIADQVHPLCRNWLAATEEIGIGLAEDYNGPSMTGGMLYQLTIRDGIRASASRCYLRPALKRPNLDLVTGAHVTGLELDGGRVTGVHYRKGGEDHLARAGQEVILSAGAVASPQILMLSGLGPGQHLAGHGIEVRKDMAAVGQHLQDHVGVDFHYRSKVPTLNQELRPWSGRVKAALQYLLTRRGPLALSINQGGGFFRLGAGDGPPDEQLYFSPVSYTRAPKGQRPMMSPDPFPGFLMGYSACRPTSRGEITLGSADPFAAPRIQPRYFDTEQDRTLALAAMRFLRDLAATDAMSSVIVSEFQPGPAATSDEELCQHLRDTAWTVFHPCSTCRMGQDAKTSVVDPRLHVHGVDGLRVADASVFPNITSGNINAPTIMVAEKAADLILEDASR